MKVNFEVYNVLFVFRKVEDLQEDHLKFLINQMEDYLRTIFRGEVSASINKSQGPSSGITSSYLIVLFSYIRDTVEGTRITKKVADLEVLPYI